MNISEKLKYQRKKNGLSQNDVAKNYILQDKQYPNGKEKKVIQN